MGPHRVLTVDLHCGQIQGFFRDIPVDNLYADDLFIEHVRGMKIPHDRLIIVSPDAGGVARARRVADRLEASGVVVCCRVSVAQGR
jgi:ribose-phosphate pyrophosphokinase